MNHCKAGSRINSRKLLLAAAIASATPLYPTLAVAQESGAMLEEVIVTASRREQNIMDVPTSMTLIDSEMFAESGITDINALADFVPGLQAVDGGSPSLGGVNIRGINLGGSVTVGIYIDDVNYGPIVGGGGTSLALDATLLDLENIEVVRGPQGTLYGAGAVGGVIKYKTREPSLEEFEGYISADISNTQYGDLNQIYRGRISVPLIEDKLAISFSGFYEDADGYIDAAPGIPNQPESGKKDVNGHEFQGGSVTVLFQPTDEFSIKLTALRNESEFSEAGYIPIDFEGNRILPERLTTTFIGPRVNEYDMYSLVMDYDFGWGTLTSVTSDQELFFDNAFDLTNSLVAPGLTYSLFTDILTGSPFGTTTNVLFNSTLQTERFSQEIRLTSANSEVFEWLVGLYYTDQESDDLQGIKATPAFNLLDVSGPTTYEEQAAFVNGTYYFSPETDMTIGIRYSDTDGTVDRLLDGALLGGATVFPGQDETNTTTTYLINVRHRPNEDMALYARAASGFRPGGPNIDGSQFDPDSLWTYEGGIKGELFEGTVTYDLSIFHTIWDDAQLPTTVLGSLGGTSNARDDVIIQGLEFFAMARPTDNWQFTTAFSYNDSELDGDEPDLGASANESLTGTPDITLTVSADYFFEVFGAPSYVGANWRHVGDYSTGFSNSLALGLPDISNDAYNVVDLRAGIDFDSVSLGLYATNITNADDFQTIFASDFLAVQLRPRTIGMNVRYNF